MQSENDRECEAGRGLLEENEKKNKGTKIKENTCELLKIMWKSRQR